LFRARSSVFEQWLGKQGVKVPGAPPERILQEQFIEDAVDETEVA
jgi:hypothetical protein